MGELFEKLRRRREQVDEGGLHFESKPSERIADQSQEQTPGRRLSTELVFESQPSEQTADCRAERSGAVPFDKSRSAPARSAPPLVTSDFRSAIDRQRSHVDEKGSTWNSTPEKKQEAEDEAKSPEDEAKRRAQELDEMAARKVAEHQAAEEEEARQKAREEAEQKAAEEAAQEAAEDECTEEGEVEVKRSTVKWRVGLTNFPRIEEFESPAFHLGGYGPVHLRLRGTGDNCQLSLHADCPRPGGARARLWVGKGWAKGKADKEWRDGDDMLTTFHVSLVGRPSILCGIAYHIP